jgi:pimeloyl-ACP methyl ester carboxylesterase
VKPARTAGRRRTARRPSTDNVVRFLDTLANLDVSALTAQVTCPTVIVHARGDRPVPVSQERELAAFSRVHLLDSGNHVVMADGPARPGLVQELDELLDGA